MGESEVLRAVLAIVESFAKLYPEVADFFGALVSGDAAARERLAAVLPAGGASRAAVDELAKTDPAPADR